MNADNPFGVLEFLNWNHPWNNYKYSDSAEIKKCVTLMQEADVGWVRMDFLWDEIEPAQGRFEFAKYDEIVRIVSDSGINILGILDYCTPWASPNGAWNYPPKDDALFVNYAKQVISRYKDKVKHWEVWNEPDSSVYWFSQDGLKRYSGLLKAVYLVAKEIDPQCKILNGGFANPNSFVGKLYDNVGRDYFDILNIHIFVSPYNPVAAKAIEAYVRQARKVMQRNSDDNKKIWITEIGSPGVKRVMPVGDWWLGRNPSEAEQASWVEQVYLGLLANPAVEKVFWAFFRDCKEHWSSGVDYFGLIRWDFSPKPAFFAYKKCVANWRAQKSGLK